MTMRFLAAPYTQVLIAHPAADPCGSDSILPVAGGWNVTVTVPSEGPFGAVPDDRGAAVLFCPAPVLCRSAPSALGRMRQLEALEASAPGVKLLRLTQPTVALVKTVTVLSWILLSLLLRTKVLCQLHEVEGTAAASGPRLLALPILLVHRIVAISEIALEAILALQPVAVVATRGMREVIMREVVMGVRFAHLVRTGESAAPAQPLAQTIADRAARPRLLAVDVVETASRCAPRYQQDACRIAGELVGTPAPSTRAMP